MQGLGQRHGHHLGAEGFGGAACNCAIPSAFVRPPGADPDGAAVLEHVAAVERAGCLDSRERDIPECGRRPRLRESQATAPRRRVC